jgi:predicted metal-binding protein
MGRPGIGVYLKDAEKVAMAIAAAGTTLLPADATPITALMTDLKTGKMEKDCLNYRLLSVIVEGGCPQEKLPDVMKALQKVSKEIDTVFSLGLIVVTDEHGKTDALDCLDDLGIAQPFRGKVNVGLGRPLADV